MSRVAVPLLFVAVAVVFTVLCIALDTPEWEREQRREMRKREKSLREWRKKQMPKPDPDDVYEEWR